MLEFLSNESWLNPQIDYLIYLQNMRMHLNPIFDEVLMWVTKFGELEIPALVMLMIYWCFDFKAGIYLFTLNSFGLLISQFLKMVACVYRPWVLSDRVHPVQAAFGNAGGYSFPSGHTSMAATSWGGMAYLAAKKHKILCAILILAILFVGFSRNYLGVHTPQDIVGGLLIGGALIFAIPPLIDWCDKDKNRYLYLLVLVNILIILFLIYVFTKNYPQDYVNGKLLVNPERGMYNTVIYAGWISGVMNGVCVCARFFPFDPKAVSDKVRSVRAIVGVILALSILPVVQIFFDKISNYSYTFLILFLTGFFLTAVYPFMFTRFEKFMK